MEIHLFFDRVKLAFEFFVRTNERTLEEKKKIIKVKLKLFLRGVEYLRIFNNTFE